MRDWERNAASAAASLRESIIFSFEENGHNYESVPLSHLGNPRKIRRLRASCRASASEGTVGISTPMNPKEIFAILKETASDWMEDQAPTLGAALAYYTVFSLAPLLIIAIAIAGLVFGQEAAQGQIFEQLRGVLGDASGKAMQDMVQTRIRSQRPGLLRP
jgi:hypothetical protein